MKEKEKRLSSRHCLNWNWILASTIQPKPPSVILPCTPVTPPVARDWSSSLAKVIMNSYVRPA